MCIEKKIQTLMELTYSENIAELSIALSVSQSTIRTWKARKKIPERIVNQANQIFAMGPPRAKLKSSLSPTLLRTEEKVDMNELKSSIMDGIFCATRLNMISLNKEVKIGAVADTIASEILEKYPSIFKNKNNNN